MKMFVVLVCDGDEVARVEMLQAPSVGERLTVDRAAYIVKERAWSAETRFNTSVFCVLSVEVDEGAA